MEPNKLKVGVFVPCVVDQFMVAVAEKMVRILEQEGAECRYPADLTCCGHALFSAGDREGAKELGARLIDACRAYDYVVTPSSGCAAYIRKQLGALFAHSARYNEALQLAARCYELSDFLVRVLHYQPSAAFPHKVGLVDHGRSLRDYGLRESPRQLLNSLQGLEIIELGELDTGLCFAAANPDVAIALLERTVRRANEQGAQYIVATEPSLLLQLQGYCAKQGLEIKCRHIIELLAT